jgi:transcriptional regulator with XRE-family HTH domain
MSIAHSDRLAGAMRKALAHLPGSLNSLAKRAGVSQTLLWQIRDGSRGVTPAIAAKVAAGLERWGEESRAAALRCQAAAKAIRRAVRTQRGRP